MSDIVRTSDAVQSQDKPVQCPFCGCEQFSGDRKVTTLGWTLIIIGLVNLPISFLLMSVCIGWVTIFLSPPLVLFGRLVCRKHVNSCARCRREW